MGRKCNRLQQKLHKTSAKNLALTAFLVRIGFLPAIWELPVLLMPTLHRVCTCCSSFLTPHHTAVLLNGTWGRAALQLLPKEAFFRAVIPKVPAPDYSLRRGKAYSTEGSEGMDAFNKLGHRPEAEMSFLSLPDVKAPCNMELWGRQRWGWRNTVS